VKTPDRIGPVISVAHEQEATYNRYRARLAAARVQRIFALVAARKVFISCGIFVKFVRASRSSSYWL
jgi:hypothetical protein